MGSIGRDDTASEGRPKTAEPVLPHRTRGVLTATAPTRSAASVRGYRVDVPERTPVSVVVPLFNDVQGIRTCCDAIARQIEEVSDILEVIVIDGGSVDGSRETVLECSRHDPRFRLEENPDKYVPFALNKAIAQSKGDVIVRVDSRSTIPDDYVDQCIRTLRATDADVVGGSMVPTSGPGFTGVSAWAWSSPWAVGGSHFHLADHDGPADAAYNAAFPKRTFERFGLFDVRFLRNQDDEFTYRVRERGGLVWLSADLKSAYAPPTSLRGLARKYHWYGRFKPLVLLTHPSGLRIRHLAPPLAVIAWALLPFAARRRIFAVPAMAHVGFAATVAAPEGMAGLGSRALALLAIHLGYGSGFVMGALSLGARGKVARRMP